MNLLKKFVVQIMKPEKSNDLDMKTGETAHFILFLNELKVGELSLKEDEWSFQYSGQFINQNEIKPLTDFPDIHKVYSSKILWPFFAFRIPGLAQPRVQNIIEKKKIDKSNISELLKEFGKKSINSPFVLVPQR